MERNDDEDVSNVKLSSLIEAVTSRGALNLVLWFLVIVSFAADVGLKKPKEMQIKRAATLRRQAAGWRRQTNQHYVFFRFR